MPKRNASFRKGIHHYQPASITCSSGKPKTTQSEEKAGLEESRETTSLTIFRDSFVPSPFLPLSTPAASRRITVNLAIFGKFRWGRWRRPRAPFSSCRRGLQTEPSREEWGLLVPRVPGSRANLIALLVVGKGLILLCRTQAFPTVRMKAQGETEGE